MTAADDKVIHIPVIVSREEYMKEEEVSILGNKKKVITYNFADKIDRSWYEVFFTGGLRVNDRLKQIYVRASKYDLIVRPKLEDVFNVFTMPIDAINVVIIGQDPYPGWNTELKSCVANGYSFATDLPEVPGSLSRMLNVITKEFGPITFADKEKPYSLRGWRNQGVFLLNKTPILLKTKGSEEVDERVRAQLDYPKDAWEDITLEVCMRISKVRPHCKFILVGKETHKFEKDLPNCITTSHPSHRNSQEFTADCFKAVSEINWCLV